MFFYFVALDIHWSIGVIAGLIVVGTLAALLKTTITEPGILPRQQQERPERPDGSSAPTVRVNGVRVTLRWCDTCRLYRPPRAKHCRLCDNCIQDFDHHCPWVCNCVGARNYRYFVLFVGLVTLYVTFVSITCLYTLIHASTSGESSNFVNALTDNLAATALLMLGATISCCTCGLFWFHISLIAKSVTTNEYIANQSNVMMRRPPPGGNAHDAFEAALARTAEHPNEPLQSGDRIIPRQLGPDGRPVVTLGGTVARLKDLCCTPLPASYIDLKQNPSNQPSLIPLGLGPTLLGPVDTTTNTTGEGDQQASQIGGGRLPEEATLEQQDKAEQPLHKLEPGPKDKGRSSFAVAAESPESGSPLSQGGEVNQSLLRGRDENQGPSSISVDEMIIET